MCIIYHVDLQRYLPQIFGNMSDTILHKANNLNAKDERFISQGVYNMLFGTVELLMISAEEAKITEDSGLSAANRSQVGRNGSDQFFFFREEQRCYNTIEWWELSDTISSNEMSCRVSYLVHQKLFLNSVFIATLIYTTQ